MKPAQINLAPVINVIEIVLEPAIDAQELIPARKVSRAAGDRSASSGCVKPCRARRKGEIAVIDDLIEQFFGQLGVGHGFNCAGGLESPASSAAVTGPRRNRAGAASASCTAVAEQVLQFRPSVGRQPRPSRAAQCRSQRLERQHQCAGPVAVSAAAGARDPPGNRRC